MIFSVSNEKFKNGIEGSLNRTMILNRNIALIIIRKYGSPVKKLKPVVNETYK